LSAELKPDEQLEEVRWLLAAAEDLLKSSLEGVKPPDGFCRAWLKRYDAIKFEF
jgi:hypothetical protein